MFFTVVNRFGDYPTDSRSQVFLTWDDWNDFSFYTLFGIFYIDDSTQKHDLGEIKIGFYGQKERDDKLLKEGDSFDWIGESCFSVGVDDSYYEKLNELGEEIRDKILKGLNDIAKDADIYNKAIEEMVTKVSFLRSNSETTITGQFRRLASGGSRLTRYNFEFISPLINSKEGMTLSFLVEPYSNPPSNIHILIGRNGVGKTFLINNMINSLTKNEGERKEFGEFNLLEELDNKSDLFANLICITFSAFDTFNHPPESKDKSLGIQYSYIGLKDIQSEDNANTVKNPDILKSEFVKSFISCKYNSKTSRWKRAITMLESDPIFRNARVAELSDISDPDELNYELEYLFDHLSSGHKIVLLTITRLVEKLQERSLVLIDEPESHLHPPLLSSFIRALSDLLIDRNGVSIIATHSPVILQEVPRSCVWKLRRSGSEAKVERLQIETFVENVGILTQEVFGLELTDSGFHKILKDLVNSSASYDEAVFKLDDQIGLEAKAILRSLFFDKNNSSDQNS